MQTFKDLKNKISGYWNSQPKVANVAPEVVKSFNRKLELNK